MKEIARNLFRKAGFELKQYSPASSEHSLMKTIIFRNKIDLIIDVGANTGQFGLFLRQLGYSGPIISFEPLEGAYQALARTAGKDKKWQVINCAVGNESGEITLNVAGNSYSSSVLDMHETHVAVAPQSQYVNQEKVPIRKLSEAIDPAVIRSAHSVLVKVDVQGYEMEVIKGALPILPFVHMVQMELSLVPLYRNAPLLNEVLAAMESFDFSLFSFVPEFVDLSSGRMLQANGTFINNRP